MSTNIQDLFYRYNSIFNTPNDIFTKLNPYKSKKIMKLDKGINIVIPIKETLEKIYHKEFTSESIEKLYNQLNIYNTRTVLEWEIINNTFKRIIELYKFNEAQFISCFIYTIQSLFKKYNFKDTYYLSYIFSRTMQEFYQKNFFTSYYKGNIKLKNLMLIVIEQKICIDSKYQNNDEYLLKIYMEIFDANKHKNDLTHRINAMGQNIFSSYLDKFYKYILNVNNDKLLKANLLKYLSLIKYEKTEEIVIKFMNEGLYNDDGLIALKNVNSIYADKYESVLLIEELKNGKDL